MPGPISDSYPGMPICACQHFKDLHDENGCTAENCSCKRFREIDFDESELGQAMNDFLGQFAKNYDSDDDGELFAKN